MNRAHGQVVAQTLSAARWHKSPGRQKSATATFACLGLRVGQCAVEENLFGGVRTGTFGSWIGSVRTRKKSSPDPSGEIRCGGVVRSARFTSGIEAETGLVSDSSSAQRRQEVRVDRKRVCHPEPLHDHHTDRVGVAWRPVRRRRNDHLASLVFVGRIGNIDRQIHLG
jgi:hypothetical protein